MQIPKHVWIEMFEVGAPDACDVIVEMEDGCLYTAVFVTLEHLKRQMDLSHAVSKQLPDTPPVRYAALETPHALLERIDRDTIEDTIDNLLALDVFEGLFTQVTEDPSEMERTTSNGNRATSEVAAVVMSDVLVVKGE